MRAALLGVLGVTLYVGAGCVAPAARDGGDALGEHEYSDGLYSAADSQQATSAPESPARLVTGTCNTSFLISGTTGCEAPTLTVVVTPETPRLRHSGRPPEYLGPIVIQFSEEVRGVSVEVPRGFGNAMYCDGTTFGTITGFSASGAVVAVKAMALTDESDCGTDRVTWGSRGGLPLDAAIARLRIDPAAPATFPVLGITGILTAQYQVSFGDGRLAIEVTCTPSTVRRGDEISCRGRLNTSRPFVVTLRQARGQGYTVEDRTRVIVPAGGGVDWSGEAIATGAVTMSAEVEHGGSTITVNSRAATFEVTPRAWPDWQYRNLTARLVALAGRMTPYPRPRSRLGAFQPEPPEASQLAISRAASGPNAGLGYLPTPYVVSDYILGVHPALSLSEYSPSGLGYADMLRWVNDQNGSGGGTCQQAAIPVLRAAVERHEGVQVVPNSHPGIGNAQFAQVRPQVLVEQITGPQGDDELRARVTGVVAGVLNTGAYATAQAQFDEQDYPLVFASAGCQFDFESGDE